MLVWKKSVALAIDLVVNDEVKLLFHLSRQSSPNGGPVRLGLELRPLCEDAHEAVMEGHLES